MPHLMPRGRVCGKPDGHKGQHRSREAVERNRAHQREYERTKYGSNPEHREQKLAYAHERYISDSLFRLAHDRAARRYEARKRLEGMAR